MVKLKGNVKHHGKQFIEPKMPQRKLWSAEKQTHPDWFKQIYTHKQDKHMHIYTLSCKGKRRDQSMNKKYPTEYTELKEKVLMPENDKHILKVSESNFEKVARLLFPNEDSCINSCSVNSSLRIVQ